MGFERIAIFSLFNNLYPEIFIAESQVGNICFAESLGGNIRVERESSAIRIHAQNTALAIFMKMASANQDFTALC